MFQLSNLSVWETIILTTKNNCRTRFRFELFWIIFTKLWFEWRLKNYSYQSKGRLLWFQPHLKNFKSRVEARNLWFKSQTTASQLKIWKTKVMTEETTHVHQWNLLVSYWKQSKSWPHCPAENIYAPLVNEKGKPKQFLFIQLAARKKN